MLAATASDFFPHLNERIRLPVLLPVTTRINHHAGREIHFAAKTRGHCDVELCGVSVGEIVKAERSLITVDPCRLIAPVTGPEHPENEIGAVWLGKSCQLVDAAMFAGPIPRSDVVDSLVARVAERRRLLCREVAALRLRDSVEIFSPLKRRASAAAQAAIGPVLARDSAVP